MPRWKAPDLPDGPLRELNRALHALHGRAGWPSSRDLQKAIGGSDVISYTTIHQALTKPVLPRWGVVELVVEELRKLAGTRCRPTDTVESFKELYDRAYEAPEPVESEAPDMNAASGSAPEPLESVGRTDAVSNQIDEAANWTGGVADWTVEAANRTTRTSRTDRTGSSGEDGGAARLRDRVVGGSYPLGSRLPPQRQLADELRVSRDTVQRVLRDLRNEGWIQSRQGSGSVVIRASQEQSATRDKWPRRPTTLGRLLGRAFEQREVVLDVYTLTSESLSAPIRLQAERIRDQVTSPQSISLRILLPDESLEFPYWRSRDGVLDDALRERALDITRRHITALHHTLSDLYTSRLVPSVRFEVRRVHLVPPCKLYLINETEALQGFYEVTERLIELNGRRIEAIDVLGLDATLTHHLKDDDPGSQGSSFVASARRWFESVWRLAHDNG